MKFIYAGYCKTGTKSIGLAFKKLGYKVYDFEETMMFHHNQWIEIFDTKTSQARVYQLLYEMYKDVDVVCDAPGFFYWREILEVFPEAKCIFYERPDHEKWFESMAKQQLELGKMMPGPDVIRIFLATIFIPTMNRLGKFSDVCNSLLFSSTLRPRRSITNKLYTINKTTSIMNYRKHNADFIINCPENRRYIIEKGQFGQWSKEFCKFIDPKMKIPDFEFPRENVGGSIVDKSLEGQGSMGDDEANFKNTVRREFLHRLVGCLIALVAGYIFSRGLYNEFWKN